MKNSTILATLRIRFRAVNSKVPIKLFKRAPKKVELTIPTARKTRLTLLTTSLRHRVSFVWLWMPLSVSTKRKERAILT